jgi:hypothetical protein
MNIAFPLLLAALLGAGPVGPDGRPLIKKLGTIGVDTVETTPIVFNGILYRYESDRVSKGCSWFVEHDTGRTTPPFGSGWIFGSAFADNGTMYVTGTRSHPNSTEVHMFVSTDPSLAKWQDYAALQLPGYGIFNTSICKAKDKFVMAFEIDKPAAEAGVAFTIRFATSTDMRHWSVTPADCVYSKDRYTAAPAIRYQDGWYYLFYLEVIRAGYENRGGSGGFGFETYVVRSRNLVRWELSPLNPVLRATADDRLVANPKLAQAHQQRIAKAVDANNSDLDFCEYQGRVILNYSWGNQLGVEHLAEAVYEGSQADFLRGWFPDRKPAAKHR